MESSLTDKLFHVEGSRKSFDAELINFIRKGDYDKVESIIRGHHVKKLIDSDGTHLLHVAAKYNNIRLINYFIMSGCKLNIKDSTKVTPLLTAVIHENYRVAKILYATQLDTQFAQLDLRYIQGRDFNRLRELTRRKLEIPLRNDLIFQMRKKQLSSERIGEVLVEVTNCQLIDVVQLRDPVITKVFLQYSSNIKISETEAFDFVLPTFDLQHILVLLNYNEIKDDEKWDSFGLLYYHKVTDDKKWYSFCRCLMNNIVQFDKTEAGRNFLKGIFSWDIFTEKSLTDLERTLMKSNSETLKIFLKYNFHVMAEAKYNRDLLTCLFSSHDPEVLSLLIDEEIDVNGRADNGNTPLHFAIDFHMPIEFMKILLDRGANPNLLNDKRRTPLQKAFSFGDEKKIKLLLSFGANMYLVDHPFNAEFYYSSFRFSSISSKKDIVELIIAQLVVYETLDQKVGQMIGKLMDGFTPDLETFLQKCRQQVNEFKTHNICEITDNQQTCKYELTIYTILAENPENIACYFGSEEFQAISAYIESSEKIVIQYYRDLLIRRAQYISKLYTRLHECRNSAVSMICQITGIHDPYSLIVEKIVNYLNADDLQKFATRYTVREEKSSEKNKTKLWFKLTKRNIFKILTTKGKSLVNKTKI